MDGAGGRSVRQAGDPVCDGIRVALRVVQSGCGLCVVLGAASLRRCRSSTWQNEMHVLIFGI